MKIRNSWGFLLMILAMPLFFIGCYEAGNLDDADLSVVQPEEPVGIKAEPKQIEGSLDADESKPEPHLEQNPKSSFVMQELPQLSSPFTKERVLILNAIVAKSLEVINEFDDERKSIDTQKVDQLKSFRSSLEELSQRAADIRKEMAEAKVDLIESGEEYNKPIFAAMEKFVNDVDIEIKKEMADVLGQISDENQPANSGD